jgi:maltooligosyltrehalose trehalohydrolase
MACCSRARIGDQAARASSASRPRRSHDQVGNRAFGERLTRLVPPAAAELATLLALLTPATPLLLFGEEFGATEPFLYFADWEGELREAVREGRQREFGHAAGANGGTELPDPCSADTFAASRPDPAQRDTDNGRRWLQLVRAALAVRRSEIAPRQQLLLTGQHRSERIGATGIRVRWRYGDGALLALDLNIGAAPIDIGVGHGAPADASVVFQHQRSDADPRARTWPAWSALWWVGNNGAAAAPTNA